MNGVIGMSSLLESTHLIEEQREYATTIRNSADALLTVINDILDFSKIEAGKMTVENVPFSMRIILEEVSDLLSARCPRERAKSLSARFPQHLMCPYWAIRHVGDKF